MRTGERSERWRSPAEDGGTAALVALYRAEHEPMVRLAVLLTGSASSAEDLVHDAFLRIHPLLDGLHNPGAYLRRMVVNLCRTHHRRRGVEQRWLARQRPPGAELAPELDETWQALDRLSTLQRHVLVLRFYLDLRLEDIAGVLDVPLGTVKSNLHRGITALGREVDRLGAPLPADAAGSDR